MAQFERVTVSAIGADERPLRYDAHPDVLTSPLSVDALRSFYAIGGTRIKLLDALLALALFAGISVPADKVNCPMVPATGAVKVTVDVDAEIEPCDEDRNASRFDLAAL